MLKMAPILAVFLLAFAAGADTTAPAAADPTLPEATKAAGYSAMSNQTWGEGYFDVKPEDKRKRAEQLYRELMESPLALPDDPKPTGTADETISK